MTFSEAKTMLEEYRKYKAKYREVSSQIDVFQAQLEYATTCLSATGSKSGYRSDKLGNNIYKLIEAQQSAQEAFDNFIFLCYGKIVCRLS